MKLPASRPVAPLPRCLAASLPACLPASCLAAASLLASLPALPAAPAVSESRSLSRRMPRTMSLPVASVARSAALSCVHAARFTRPAFTRPRGRRWISDDGRVFGGYASFLCVCHPTCPSSLAVHPSLASPCSLLCRRYFAPFHLATTPLPGLSEGPPEPGKNLFSLSFSSSLSVESPLNPPVPRSLS